MWTTEQTVSMTITAVRHKNPGGGGRGKVEAADHGRRLTRVERASRLILQRNLSIPDIERASLQQNGYQNAGDNRGSNSEVCVRSHEGLGRHIDDTDASGLFRINSHTKIVSKNSIRQLTPDVKSPQMKIYSGYAAVCGMISRTRPFRFYTKQTCQGAYLNFNGTRTFGSNTAATVPLTVSYLCRYAVFATESTADDEVVPT